MIGKGVNMWLLLLPSQQGSLAVTLSEARCFLLCLEGAWAVAPIRELAPLDQRLCTELAISLALRVWSGHGGQSPVLPRLGLRLHFALCICACETHQLKPNGLLRWKETLI